MHIIPNLRSVSEDLWRIPQQKTSKLCLLNNLYNTKIASNSNKRVLTTPLFAQGIAKCVFSTYSQVNLTITFILPLIDRFDFIE